MKLLRSAVERITSREGRARREPLSYLGSFGDDIFGCNDDDDEISSGVFVDA